MMFLIFFPFIHSAKVRDSWEEYFNYYREKARKLPNFGILLDIPDITQEEIDRRQSAINNLRSCSMSDKYEGYDQNYLNQYTDICRIIVDAFQGLFISNGTNVNDVIAQVPSKTQLLFIGTSVNQKVNFSEFQSPVSVLCVDIDRIFPDFSFTQTSIRNSFNNLVKTVINSSVDGTPKSFIDLFRNLKKDDKKTSYSSSSEIQIIGSMNEKVSYLYAFNFNITFADEACNAQNLHLDYYSVLSPSSKGIESEFLYLSSNSIQLAKSLAGKVNQTTIIHNDANCPCYTLTIEYKKDSLSVARSDCTCSNGGTRIEIPYSSSTQSIGFIADYDYDEYTEPLTVYVNFSSNERIENILNLNLSFGHNYNVNLYDFDGIDDFLPTHLEKSLSKRLKNSLPQVQFEYSDTWDDVEKPQLTVVSDASVINVDTSKVADKFTVTREAPAVIEREGGGGDDDDGLSAGAIAGIVIACVVVVAAIVAVVVYFVVFRKKRDSSQEADK